MRSNWIRIGYSIKTRCFSSERHASCRTSACRDGERRMRSDLFQPTEEGEARLLILIASLSGPTRSLEGRTKLAKLDFLLRYPTFLRRALAKRGVSERALSGID